MRLKPPLVLCGSPNPDKSGEIATCIGEGGVNSHLLNFHSFKGEK
jgi:hypothetical protein